MFKNAKKLLSILLVAAMLITAIPFGAFAAETTEATATNILEDEKAYASFATAPLAQRLLDGDAASGQISEAHFELANAGPTEILTASPVKDENGNIIASAPRSNWNAYIQKHTHKTDSEAAKYETVADLGMYEEDVMRDLVKEGNETIYRFQIADSANHRTAFVFRLGGYYNVDTFKLKQSINASCGCNRAIQKFTVYAGNELNGSIWQNPVGTGGSNEEDEMVVTLNGANAVKYLVVVLDVVMPPSMNNIWAQDGYNIPYIKGFAAYGEETQAPVENVLANENAVVGEYKINLADPITASDTFETVVSKLKYDNLSAYDSPMTYVAGYNKTEAERHIYKTTSLTDAGLTKAQAFDMLEDTANTQPLRLSMSDVFNYRYAIAYDLGDEYTLDKFVLTQNLTNVDFYDVRKVYRYSVYAGNTLDATIFENCVGVGGSTIDADMAIDLEGATNVRYLIVVLDHMTRYDDGKVCPYSYYANITNIAAYGTKRENLAAKDTTVGNLYSIELDTEIPAELTPDEMQPYLVYKNIKDVNLDNTSYSEFWFYDSVNKTRPSDRYTSNDEVIKKAIIEKGNTEKIVITSESSYGYNTHRAALGFDLGANYNLEKLQLTQSTDCDQDRNIYRYSVYAGDVFNASIFNEENKIATGGGDTTEIGTTFKEGAQGRYVVIVFDHVSLNWTKDSYHKNAYIPFGIDNIVLHGEEAPVAERENILTKPEVVGDLYTTDLAVALISNTPADASTAEDVYDKVRYPYNHLAAGNASFSGDAVAGLNNDQIIDQLILAEKNAVGTYIYVTKPLEQRAGIGFDLGGYYNLDTLKLYQGDPERPIYNLSVYAGNKMDASIFNNRVGIATAANTCEQYNVALEGAEKVRYILVMFDHVAMFKGNYWGEVVNPGSYYPKVNDIMLYGEASSAPDVAKIGDVGYASFEEAVAAAVSGDTITLLADVETAATIEIAGKELTFDLNDYTITGTEERALFLLKDGAKLTVQNGTLVSKDLGIRSNGNGTAANTIVVDNVTMTSDYFGIYHNGNNYGADVTVNGSTITDNFDAGIYLSGNASWGENRNSLTITDSAVSGASAVEVKYTDVTVEGSTLTATLTGEKVLINNANGTCTGGYALAVTNNTNANGTEKTTGSLTIGEGNTFNGGIMVKAEADDNDVVVIGDTEAIQVPAGYKWVDGKLTLKADIDGDGDVTAQDLVKAKKMLLGVQTKDDTLDITGDGIFNILDFIAIHKLVG